MAEDLSACGPSRDGRVLPGWQGEEVAFSLPLPDNSESESEVTQLGPILCDQMPSSLPGSSIHGIFQARVLEWVAISFSKADNKPYPKKRVDSLEKALMMGKIEGRRRRGRQRMR